MTDNSPTDPRLEVHRLRLQAAGAIPMTAEEVLAGQTQAGVPRPAFQTPDDDDGTVERVGLARGDA